MGVTGNLQVVIFLFVVALLNDGALQRVPRLESRLLLASQGLPLSRKLASAMLSIWMLF
jgi:hypothetical protein